MERGILVREYGYEYEVQLDKELWEETKDQVTYDTFLGAMCLRSGRDALKIVAREYEPTTVLLPALSCDSMIAPFTLYGHCVKYYRLNKDYSINLDDLFEKIRDVNKPVLFLYMDYFGKQAISDKILYQLKENCPNVVFIEDRTHTLLSEKIRSFEPEYTVASLRKWIDIPDGGLLWSKVDFKNRTLSDNLDFSITRLNAQCMRYEFLESGDLELKKKFRNIFSTVADLIDNEQRPGRMSAYSLGRAKQYDLTVIADKRRANAEALIKELKEAGYELIQSEAGASDVYVSILIENRNKIQNALAAKGIFCTIIWPLNEEQKDCCQIAKRTEEHMLSIYCDQRYTVDDMKYIALQIVRSSNE